MDLDDLGRVLRRSFAGTLVAALLLWFAWDWNHGAGLLFGGLWSTANIWSLKKLVEGVFTSQQKWKIFWLAQIKLPLLYGLGALVLFTIPLSVGAGLFGFQIPFLLILLEAIKNSFLDEPIVKPAVSKQEKKETTPAVEGTN